MEGKTVNAQEYVNSSHIYVTNDIHTACILTRKKILTAHRESDFQKERNNSNNGLFSLSTMFP